MCVQCFLRDDNATAPTPEVVAGLDQAGVEISRNGERVTMTMPRSALLALLERAELGNTLAQVFTLG